MKTASEFLKGLLPSLTIELLPYLTEYKHHLKVTQYTGLHTQKAYTHTGTSFPQILLLSPHAYMHFAVELQLDSHCVHHGVRIQV